MTIPARATNGAADDDGRMVSEAGASVFDAYELPAGADPIGADDEPASSSSIEAYTPAELAQLLAGLSAFGIPLEHVDAYQRAILARTRPALEVLEVGDALMAYGIGKGGPGLSALPAWARLAAGVAVVGVTVHMTRKEHTPSESVAPNSGDRGGSPGASSTGGADA